MARNKDIVIKLKADTKEYTKNIDNAKKETGKVGIEAEKAGNKTTKSFAKMAAGIGAAVLALKALTSQMSSAITASNTQEKAEKRLITLVKISTKNYEQATKELMKYANVLAKVGVVGDEVILAGQSQLATFQLQADSIKKLTPALLDLIVATEGVNASEGGAINAANMLGKVFAGQVGALSRAGISMNDYQKEMLRTGDQLQKVDVLVEVLNSNIGGLNKSMRETGAGALQSFDNTVSDLQEDIGDLIKVAILPLVQDLKDFAAKISAAKDENTDLIRLFKILGLVLSNIAKVFITLIDSYALYTAKFMDFTEEILNAGKYVLDFFSGADVEAQRLLETTEKATKEAALNRAREIGLTGQLNEQFEKLIATAGIFGNIGSAIKDNISKNIEDGIAKAKELQDMISSPKMEQITTDDSAELEEEVYADTGKKDEYEAEEQAEREHLEQLKEITDEFKDIEKEAKELELEELFEWYNSKLEIAQGNEQAEFEISAIFAKKKDDLDDKYAKMEENRTLRGMKTTLEVLQNLGSAYSDFGKVAKRAAQAQALIDTYAAANATWKSASGIPFVGPFIAPVMVAAVIASGLANVANIESTKFAKGGVLQGNSHANGGIQLYGRNGNHYGEAEGGEPILTKAVSSSPQLLTIASAVNELAGGVALSGRLSVPKMEYGGITQNAGLTPENRQLSDINNRIGALNRNIAEQEKNIVVQVELPETNILNNKATLNTYETDGLNIEEL